MSNLEGPRKLWEYNDERWEQRRELEKKKSTLLSELEEVNKLLRQTKPKAKNKIKVGDAVFYLDSYSDGTFTLKYFIYEGYASQTKKSELEPTLLLNNRECSL